MSGTDKGNDPPSKEKSKGQSRRMAYFCVIAAAVLWGTIGAFVKELNVHGFTPLQVVFVRAMGASIVLLFFLLVQNRELLRIRFRDSIYFVGTGMLSFIFFNWCYFVAIKNVSLSVAAILLYTAPAMVMVLSVVLFKEQMTSRKLISLLLTFVGCVLVTVFAQGIGGSISVLGVLAGLGSGLGYALYSIFGKYALARYSSMTVTFYTFVFAALGLIPVINGHEMVTLFSNTEVLYYGGALVLFGTVLPFVLYTHALSVIDASKASITATLEPIVATMIGILLYNEPVTAFKVAGIGLVIFAISIIREK